ncbi:MAG TPA: YcnI family protein [Chloroflexota bacterium]|nr:YcnI family protein [Chloroflexota bacterium]
MKILNLVQRTSGRRDRRPMPPLAALALALVALILGAGSAAAHVGVTPREARPATSETFTVRVPTERDEATVRVRVEFPAGLVVSRFQPKPGWQREVERDSAGQLTAVTWSGGRIEPGEYDDFLFIARTPQDAGKLSFKAYQTYEGGETVAWVDAEGAARPAAVVELKAAAAPTTSGHLSIENPGQANAPAGATSATAPAASGPGGAAATAATAPATTAGTSGAAVQAAGGGSDLPLFTALGAIALALVATAMAGVALTRRPQTS